jgi:hypothetical protein
LLEQIEGVHEGVSLKRIYLMTRNGARSLDFHQKVDGKGPVVVLIKTSKGVIFGGYTEVGFTGSNSYKRDDKCVLMNIDTKFTQRIVGSHWAVEDFPEWGPRFDAGSFGFYADPMNSLNSGRCYSRSTDTSEWSPRR